MFHRHDIEAIAPAEKSLADQYRWTLSEVELEAAVRRGRQLRAEAFVGLLGAAGRAVAGLFRRRAAARSVYTDAAGLRRHDDGNLDIEHYETLARRARARAAAEVAGTAGRIVHALVRV